MLSGLGISFQNLNLLHFDQIISLKSLSINLFLLARFLGLQLIGLRVQASQNALCSERERKRKREKEGCLSCVETYMPAPCCRGAAVFKQYQNLSAGTVLQRLSCLSDVETYLPALCCRGAAV